MHLELSIASLSEEMDAFANLLTQSTGSLHHHMQPLLATQHNQAMQAMHIHTAKPPLLTLHVVLRKLVVAQLPVWTCH
jgi:hypothetical protein